MVIGQRRDSACPQCGRSGAEKGNLVSTIDIYTQSAYLTDDGYFFLNPWWNKKLLPDPWSYLKLRKLLNAPKFPDKDKKLKLVEKLDEKTTISWELQGFKFLWIYTNQVLCWLPYEYRNVFKEATFFLRPSNEELPYFGWVRGSIEARYKNANWKWEDGKDGEKGEWIKDPQPFNPKAKENPTQNELNFLAETWRWTQKFISEYALEMETKREIYNTKYLAEVKELVRDYEENGKWYNRITRQDIYNEMRVVAHVELEKFAKHIQNKLDNTRKGYELWVPDGRFEKVNEHRMIIGLKREFVSEWYPRLFELIGMWQFQKRPLTKKQLEEWNDLGGGKKEPLKSCVFCPVEQGNRSEDYTFDNFALMRAQRDIQKEWPEHRDRLINQINLENIEETVDILIEVSESSEELGKLSDEQLKELGSSASKISSNEVSSSLRSSLERCKKNLNEELKRRGKLKDFRDRLVQERENELTQRRNLEQQLQQLREDLRTAEANHDNHQINEVNERINRANNALSRTNQRIDNANRTINELGNEVSDQGQSLQERIRQGAERMNNARNFFERINIGGQESGLEDALNNILEGITKLWD